MQDRRRAELDAKRQKLAELKKAREDRQKRDLARKDQEAKVTFSCYKPNQNCPDLLCRNLQYLLQSMKKWRISLVS